MKIRGRDDLGGLGKDEFKHVIEREGDVHALRDAGQGVHLLHAAFEVGHGLGALKGQGSLLAQVIHESQVLGGVGLSREARAQCQPAERAFLAGQTDEKTRSQQRQARFLRLEGRRYMGGIQVKGQSFLFKMLCQRAGGGKADIAGGTVVRARHRFVLVIHGVVNVDMQPVRSERVHDAFAEDLVDTLLVHDRGELVGEVLLAFQVGTLTAEQGAIHHVLQAGPDRIKQQGDDKSHDDDHPGVAERLEAFEDQGQTGDDNADDRPPGRRTKGHR